MNPFAAIAVGYAKHRPPHLDEIRAWCAETLWTDPEGDILLPGYYALFVRARQP